MERKTIYNFIAKVKKWMKEENKTFNWLYDKSSISLY